MKKTILLISACILLVGCKKELSCSSEDTQKVVNQKFLSSIHDVFTNDSDQSSDTAIQNSYTWLESHISIAMINIATVSENKDTGEKFCTAQLNVKFNNVSQKSMYDYLSKDNQSMSNFINNNVISDNNISYSSPNLSRNISYSTIMTDDNKTQLLTLSDVGELPRIISVLSILNSNSLANLSATKAQDLVRTFSSKSLAAQAVDSSNDDQSNQDNSANNASTTSIVGTIVSTHDEAGGGYGIQDDKNNIYSICYYWDDNKDILEQLSNLVDKQVTVTITGNLSDKYYFDCNSVSISQN